MARTRVARTRLTQDEHDELVAAAAEEGISPSEYLRNLIVGRTDTLSAVADRVKALESRITHVESEVAKMWAEGGHS